MLRTSMIRLLAAAATLAGVLLVAPSSSFAGGGCAAVGSQSEGAASGAATVGIRGCTFQPAILRVTGGSEVTFVNRDVTPHAVTGAGWGNAAVLEQGQSITHRFDEPGIHAYQCYLHPGMVGAIVVGNETSTAGDSTAAVDSAAAGGSPETASLALLGLSAGVAFAAGVLIARPRRRA